MMLVIVILIQNMPKKQVKNNWGFTLIELLVVISIIGVLTALLMANFMGARERAKDAQKMQDLYLIKNALRMFYNDYQSYPSCTTNSSTCLNTTAIGSTYMPAIKSGNVSYNYSVSADGDSFVLTVGLDAGSGDEDINSQTKCGISPAVNKVFAVCGK